MKHLYCLAAALLSLVLVRAQTETLPNGAGGSVVVVLSENAAGVEQTQVIATLAGTTTSQTLNPLTATTTSRSVSQTTALALTTTTPQQAGAVEQAPSTQPQPGGETPYTYTTTDALGNTIVTQGIFTPTGPATVLPSLTTTGTILGYSQWLSMIGTNTVPASAAHRVSLSVASGWYYCAATILAGLVGGAWLIVF